MQPGDLQAAVTSRPERSDELQRPDPLIGYRSIWETSEQKSRPAEHMPPTLLGDIAQEHSIALIWSQFYTREERQGVLNAPVVCCSYTICRAPRASTIVTVAQNHVRLDNLEFFHVAGPCLKKHSAL